MLRLAMDGDLDEYEFDPTSPTVIALFMLASGWGVGGQYRLDSERDELEEDIEEVDGIINEASFLPDELPDDLI